MTRDGVELRETLTTAEAGSDVVGQRVVAVIDDDLGRMLGQRPALHLHQRRLLDYMSDSLVRHH
jgi:hypothetical protein